MPCQPHQSNQMKYSNMTQRNLYWANHCDPLTSDCIISVPDFCPTRLLKSVHYCPYSGTVFSLSAMMMVFLYSTCSRKSGPTLGCKHGVQKKLMHTLSGREKGQSS